MKEKFPKAHGGGIEKGSQNIYSKNKGNIFMPQQPPTGETPKPQDLAKTIEVARRVEGGIRRYAEEETKKGAEERRAAREGKPVKPKSASEKEGELRKISRSIVEQYFSVEKIPLEVSDIVTSFIGESRGKKLEEVDTETLVKNYARLRTEAKKINADLDFLAPIELELVQNREVNLPALIAIIESENERIERVVRSMTKDIKTIDDKGISDPSLKLQVDMLNRLLAGVPDDDFKGQIDELDKGLNRISSLTVTALEQQSILIQRVTDRLALVKDQNREKEKKREEDIFTRQKERGEEAPMVHVLSPEEGRGFDPNKYNLDPRVSTLAKEIKDAIDSNQATSGFLGQKIDHLSGRRKEIEAEEARFPDRLGERASENTARLLMQLHHLKEVLATREREDHLRKMRMDWSTYGEIRQLPEEKRQLVLLALTPGSEYEIEERFNKIFARADARQTDDWQSAQGSAGQIEVDDFLTALTTVASGRLTLDYKPLEPEERDRLNMIVGKLTHEEKIRQYLHNITYYLNKNFEIDDVQKVMSQVSAEDVDLAYSTKGVVQIGHFFEQAMYEVMIKNGGYLPYEAMISREGKRGEVEIKVRDLIEKAKKIGTLPQDMPIWEIDRAVSIARGMGIVTGRTIEIVASGGIPPASGGGVLVSWWANDVIKKIAFFKQIARYDVGKERNKFLAFKMENRDRAWSTKELAEVGALANKKILSSFVYDDEDDRYIEMTNPFRIGSLFTQTGWRYGVDDVTHAGAIAALLDGNPYNPVIGAGMWVEKERKNLKNPKKLEKKDWEAVNNIFGTNLQEGATFADRAAIIIRKNLELSSDISPLKLFYNYRNLQRAVLLRPEYSDKINVDITEYPDAENQKGGQIFIKDKQFQDDLNTLAAIQEKLVRKRADEYKKYLKEKVTNPEGEPPDLYTQLRDLDGEIRGSGLEQDQIDRILRFTSIVREEFATPLGMKKLMTNLKDKGWKVPFVFGTDDLPFDLYNFTATGGSSIKRRWGDIASAAKGADAYEQLIMNMANFSAAKYGTIEKAQDAIVESLFQIYNTLRGHDEGVVREVMLKTVEGITKYYKKDWTARLPAGIGFLEGLKGRSSYAQIAFGRQGMGWDEVDIDTFVRKVRGAALINIEDEEELREKVGAEKWNLLMGVTRTATSLSFLAFIYYFIRSLEDGKK